MNQIGFGLSVTVLSMSIVFIVLVLLSYVIRVQRRIVEKIEGTKTNKPAQKAQKAVEPQKPVVQKVEEKEDEELIAVISAAVAAVLGRPTSNIVVRSIRRLEPGAPSWSIAGRNDQINSRF